jgi:hypothetical protein
MLYRDLPFDLVLERIAWCIWTKFGGASVWNASKVAEAPLSIDDFDWHTYTSQI